MLQQKTDLPWVIDVGKATKSLGQLAFVRFRKRLDQPRFGKQSRPKPPLSRSSRPAPR